MKRHDDKICMRHMLDHATEAVQMAKDRTRQDLDSDRQLNLSLARLLEVKTSLPLRVKAGGYMGMSYERPACNP